MLRICWELTDGICSKRPAPFLPQLLAKLVACDDLPGEVAPELIDCVGAMSPATIDRALASQRGAWPCRGWGTTKPGTLLKQQIPIRTFAEWDDARPDFLEIDLVAFMAQAAPVSFCSR